MGQVKFDYSKTAGYVHEHEVESMKALTESARQLLLSRVVQVMTISDGLTFLLIMIRKSLHVLRRQQKRLSQIQMCL